MGWLDGTGLQTITLLSRYGFSTTQVWNHDDGNQYRKMVDAAGRSVSTHVRDGALVKAVPGGTWVGELRRMHPEWARIPHVTTVEALGSLLGEIGTECDGRCVGLVHRDTCPAHVIPY